MRDGSAAPRFLRSGGDFRPREGPKHPEVRDWREPHRMSERACPPRRRLDLQPESVNRN
jgi:hypothetical protein